MIKSRRKGKRPSDLPTNTYIHSMIKFIHVQVMLQDITYDSLSQKSGIGANTIRKWRNAESSPKLVDIEPVLYALGYRIKMEAING